MHMALVFLPLFVSATLGGVPGAHDRQEAAGGPGHEVADHGGTQSGQWLAVDDRIIPALLLV